jgi:hypothetical protein
VFFTVNVFILKVLTITLQGNVNELPTYFGMLSNYAINNVGAESVVIRTLGNGKMQVIATLTELTGSMKAHYM